MDLGTEPVAGCDDFEGLFSLQKAGILGVSTVISGVFTVILGVSTEFFFLSDLTVNSGRKPEGIPV